MNKTKQKYSQTENKVVVTEGRGVRGRGKTEEVGQEVQTIRYKINKTQRYNVQYREYNQQFIIILNGV